MPKEKTKIIISGVIGFDVQPNDIRNQLKEADGDLIVEIGSPGGFVFDGLEIFNLIRDYKGGTKTMRLMGIAASMASYIALAGDKVEAHDNAVFMIHNAMSIAVGNQNDMRETADFLERISNLLAKAYVLKTGKSLKEIKQLMDDESYFFGEEAKESGFVDEIIETKDKKDKETALLEAKAKISNCVDTIKDLENTKEDLKKAVACLSTIEKPENKENNTDFSPATPGKVNNKIENKEENNMNALEKFLSENPGAKADYDKAIGEAVKEGEAKVNKRIEAAKPYLSNDKYPKQVAETALKVVTGEVSNEALTTIVTVLDATSEKKNSETAQTETKENGETAGEHDQTIHNSGECKTEADVDAEIKRTKELEGAR
jgi:ATP-dependent Clp endopeptidase proteolytic subunit ClpP